MTINAGIFPVAVFMAVRVPTLGRLATQRRCFRLFSSFRPWPSVETIAAMRAHPGSTVAIGTRIALCEVDELGTYLVEVTAGEAPPVT